MVARYLVHEFQDMKIGIVIDPFELCDRRLARRRRTGAAGLSRLDRRRHRDRQHDRIGRLGQDRLERRGAGSGRRRWSTGTRSRRILWLSAVVYGILHGGEPCCPRPAGQPRERRCRASAACSLWPGKRGSGPGGPSTETTSRPPTPIIGFEMDTASTGKFIPGVIPGLVQTADCAGASSRLSRTPRPTAGSSRLARST